ncbi:MAG: hypothetical protein QF408_14080 [Pirellulales bacterium]|jgi:hypothetical protein|nr:hypothetical protein [Pirellulales bacterium]|tara:strand:- start:1465 stop:1875 length:411 start_codon:yes stop_codon:yes gene_type:complete
MNQKQQAMGRESLEEVREQFRNWRSQREKGSRIPQWLWQAAVGLSDRHSVGKIATALALDHGRLKQRIATLCSLNGKSQRPSEAGIEFVSIGALPAGQADVVELEDGTGRRLKVHLVGAATGRLVEVAKALWEQVR